MESNHIFNIEEIRLRQNVKKPIGLRILVIGESGVGKSTFLNNLCNKKILQTGNDTCSASPSLDSLGNDRIKIFKKKITLNEDSSPPLTLDLVLIPGSGDHIDNSNTPEQIEGYLEKQLSMVFNEEVKIQRNISNRDSRPHVCLYFVSAISWRLKKIDIELMQKIGEKVNLIPVVSKADVLAPDELKSFRQSFMQELTLNKVRLFDFKENKVEDILGANQTDISKTYIRDLLPFSLICSDYTCLDNSNRVQHIKRFPWVDIRVEDLNNSEFILLKSILLGSHLQEFKESTNEIYEHYRSHIMESRNKHQFDILCDKQNTREKISPISRSTRRNAFSVSQDLRKSSFN